MKKLCISFLLFLFSSYIFSQQHSSGKLNSYDPGQTECLSDSMRAIIKAQNAANIAILQLQGKLPHNYTASTVLLDWPMRLRSGLVDYGYHSISGGVDHDPTYPNHLLDYNCGTRTYDTQAGYNHAGTDFFLWPFDWNKMDSGDVEIIAAAAGTIINKSDGNFDRSCGMNNNNWNAVYIQHADGSVAWYGHMKNGSLTTKTVGQTVTVGEFLGKVGSSGNSTGPHLHLEVYDPANNLNDPFQGTCNNFNSNSWWIAQLPYMDAAINHTATNFDPPVWTACSNEVIKNEKNYFTNTDTVFLMDYFRFLSLNDSCRITIYRPDNSIWSTWNWTNTWSNYNAAWVYWWMIAGSGEQDGQWKFETVYNSQTYFHYFWLGPAGIKENQLLSGASVYPNPTNGEFIIELKDKTMNFSNEKVELKIMDVLGSVILKRNLTSNKTDIQINGIAPGTYFYSISCEEKNIAIGKFTMK